MLHFHKRNRERLNWDKLPSTAASRPTVSRANTRKGTCGRLPSAQATRSWRCSRRRRQVPTMGAPRARPGFGTARARKIDAVLVTELNQRGRSTQDLVQTLDDPHGWKVSVLAQTGRSFDLSTASGKLMRTIMAGLAEFGRDLIRDRVMCGRRPCVILINSHPYTGPPPTRFLQTRYSPPPELG